MHFEGVKSLPNFKNSVLLETLVIHPSKIQIHFAKFAAMVYHSSGLNDASVRQLANLLNWPLKSLKPKRIISWRIMLLFHTKKTSSSLPQACPVDIVPKLRASP